MTTTFVPADMDTSQRMTWIELLALARRAGKVYRDTQGKGLDVWDECNRLHFEFRWEMYKYYLQFVRWVGEEFASFVIVANDEIRLAYREAFMGNPPRLLTTYYIDRMIKYKRPYWKVFVREWTGEDSYTFEALSLRGLVDQMCEAFVSRSYHPDYTMFNSDGTPNQAIGEESPEALRVVLTEGRVYQVGSFEEKLALILTHLEGDLSLDQHLVFDVKDMHP